MCLGELLNQELITGYLAHPCKGWWSFAAISPVLMSSAHLQHIFVGFMLIHQGRMVKLRNDKT